MADQESEYNLMLELRALLQAGEEDALQIFLRLVRPEDIADWLDLLSADERQRISRPWITTRPVQSSPTPPCRSEPGWSKTSNPNAWPASRKRCRQTRLRT